MNIDIRERYMYSFLKYTHLTFIALAVLLFIICFYWQKTEHINGDKVIFKKMLHHSYAAIFLVGLLLIGFLQINPFVNGELWLIEKTAAFAAYIVMVTVALDKSKRKGMQNLAFIGAFGWLAYIGKLAFTKQAILLVG